MSASVKMIRFLIFLSGILMILTYFIFINAEMKLIIVQSDWISNDLFFTLSSGAFASTLVVLLSEVRHYLTLKRDNQDQLFFQLVSIYGQLLIMQNSMKRLIENLAESVSEPLLDQSIYICRQNIAFIFNLDYTTFCSKEKVKQTLQLFIRDKFAIESLFTDCIYLKIAINADKQTHLQKCGTQGCITAQDYNTSQVLIRLQKDIAPWLIKINSYLEHLDNSVSNRYNWTSKRDNMLLYENNYTIKTLEDFLKEHYANIGLIK